MADDDATGIEDGVAREVYWPGPWHFVQAVLDAPQMWGVNHVPRLVRNEDVIGFMLTDDAMHFINSDRAIDLGVWLSREELDEAVERMRAQHQAEAKAEAEHATEPHKNRGGRPKGSKNKPKEAEPANV